jgi:putative ABC transport system permease protein
MSLEDTTLRLYRLLARALPFEFRQEYGGGLMDATDDLVRHAARGGWRRLILVIPRLLGDLAWRLVVEHCHDALRDARYAARMLSRAPGFTLAAVTCLAIGTGLTAAMYSQIQANVLREIPGTRDAAGLVRLQRPISFPYFKDLEEDRRAFSSAAAYMAPVPVVINRPGSESQRVWGHLTTPNYFEVLGARAAHGRLFGAEERTPGGRGVVLSDRLWQTRFGGDVSIVGESLLINGQTVTVLGVGAPGFLGASPTTAAADVWIPTTAPVAVAPELANLDSPLVPAFEVIGRLSDGVSDKVAEEVLEGRTRRLEQIHNDPARNSQEPRIRLLAGGRMLAVRNEDLPRAIGFPLVLVSLVLLMACGNVANMILAQNTARRREIAVRLSLGAGPGRIVRQLLTEGLMLTAVGAAAGAAFSLWLLSIFDSMRPMVPGYGHFEVRLDSTAFVLVALLAAGFAVLFGLAPALRAGREDIYAGLKPNGAAAPRRRAWFSMRNTLVFQQVAVSVMLVLLTGFVVVGWQRSAGVDVGFDPSRLHLVKMDPIRDGISPARAQRFFEQLPARLRSVPGVTAVSVAQSMPLAMSNSEAMLTAKVNFAGGATSLGTLRADRVGHGFFETIGTPLRRGRTFTPQDESDEARVIVINDTLARQVWPGEDPLGRTIDLDGTRREVVGVVGDIRSAFPLAPTQPGVYRPITPSGFAAPSKNGVTLAVRVAPGIDASTLLPREIEAIDSQVTVFEITRMVDDIAQTQYLAHFATVVYGGMGVFGLILAAVGLAGVTAQAVAQRRREIGIRMALGARYAGVLWLVLRESSAIIAAGTVAGLAAALGLTWALASVVETLAETTQTSMTDPLLLVGGPALLGALALVACYLPARRSTRIDPATVLRAE